MLVWLASFLPVAAVTVTGTSQVIRVLIVFPVDVFATGILCTGLRCSLLVSKVAVAA